MGKMTKRCRLAVSRPSGGSRGGMGCGSNRRYSETEPDHTSPWRGDISVIYGDFNFLRERLSLPLFLDSLPWVMFQSELVDLLQAPTTPSTAERGTSEPFNKFCPHYMSALYFYNLPLLSRVLPEWKEDSEERLRHISLWQCFIVALMRNSCSNKVISNVERRNHDIRSLLDNHSTYEVEARRYSDLAHWSQVYTLQIPLTLTLLSSYYLSSRVGLPILPQPTSLNCQTLRNKRTDARSSCGGYHQFYS